MKRKIWMIVPVLAFAFAGLTMVVGQDRQQSVQADFGVANSGESITKLDKNKLSVFGITLDVPQSKAKVDTKWAEEKAREAYPEFAQGASSVHVEYHLVTNHTMKNFSQKALDGNPDLKAKNHMDKLPAYIVTFSGIKFSTHTPEGYNGQSPVHTEANVIIDATSGEALMSFSYK